MACTRREHDEPGEHVIDDDLHRPAPRAGVIAAHAASPACRGVSLRGAVVAATLDRVLAAGGPGVLPRSTTVDHGTESTSRALEDWAYTRGVALDFTRLGRKATSHIESFNGRLRDEFLNTHQFAARADVRSRRRDPQRQQLGSTDRLSIRVASNVEGHRRRAMCSLLTP